MIDETLHHRDLKEVCGWLNVTSVDDIDKRFERLPMSLFSQQAREMLATYDEFPDDAARTHRIIMQLQCGESPHPIYVEEDNEDRFIMEGRHRIVAFYLEGLTEVVVCFCRRKPRADATD